MLDQTTIGLRDTVVKAQAGVTDFQENMEALKKNFLLRGFFKNRGYEDSSDLAKNEIAHLPQAEPLKTFTYEPQAALRQSGYSQTQEPEIIARRGPVSWPTTEFGVAVVVVSTSMAGDTEKDLVLTQARASVVRDYLVDNFGFDDAELKTFGVGKKNGTNRSQLGNSRDYCISPWYRCSCQREIHRGSSVGPGHAKRPESVFWLESIWLC